MVENGLGIAVCIFQRFGGTIQWYGPPLSWRATLHVKVLNGTLLVRGGDGAGDEEVGRYILKECHDCTNFSLGLCLLGEQLRGMEDTVCNQTTCPGFITHSITLKLQDHQLALLQ